MSIDWPAWADARAGLLLCLAAIYCLPNREDHLIDDAAAEIEQPQPVSSGSCQDQRVAVRRAQILGIELDPVRRHRARYADGEPLTADRDIGIERIDAA